MVSTKKTNDLAVCSAAVLLFGMAAPQANAVEYEFGIRLGVSQTDNVYLDASPNEIDDIVYRASPWIGLTHTSPTFDASLRYNFDWYEYDDIGVSNSFHMGQGILTGKLFNESLLLEVGASRRQAIRNTDDVIPSGRLPLAGNLVDRDETYAHPRIETQLGKSVTLNTGYRYAEGSYDDPLIQDDTSHHATFSLDNYAAGSGLTWALRYDGRRKEFDLSPEWEHQLASAQLGFWINERVRVFGSGGKESPWDDPFNPDLEDQFWEAGLAYAGAKGISAEIAAGERSFGSSWRGNIEYTFARGSTSASYNESPTTTGFDRSGRLSIFDDPDQIDEFLDRPGTAERYLSKRLDWNLSLVFRRTSFSLVLFDEAREGRIQADGTPLGDQAQRGASASLSWQAGARTQFVLAGSSIRREQVDLGDSDFRSLKFGVNYNLGQRTQLSLDYAYNEQEPDETNLSGREYESNVVSLFLVFTM
jgi:hypothetical protein